MIVVLVALEVERQEIRKRLAGLRVDQHPAGTHFDLGIVHSGDYPPTQIALALVGRGSSPAGVLAERAINRYRPRAVLFVGVAGGLRDWLKLGDIVVATKVYAQAGRSEDEGYRAYPQAWNIDHEIEQVARHLAMDDGWTPAPQPPRVHFEPVATGEAVMNGRETPEAHRLHQHYADAVAIEMEGAGAAHASHVNRSVPIAIIRGVSDHASGVKDRTDAQGWQQIASANAAMFALALAARLGEGDRVAEDSHRDPAAPTGPAAGRYGTATSHGDNSPVIQNNGTVYGDNAIYGSGAPR